MAKKRNYRREYDTYQSKPEQIKHREMRNKARYDVEHHIHQAVHGLSPADIKGKDLGHKKALQNGGSNSPSNWKAQSVHSNRADKNFRRTKRKDQ